jgi:hypothetical protein
LQHLGSCHDDLLLAIGTKLHNVTETKKLYEQRNKNKNDFEEWKMTIKIKQKPLNMK